MQTFQLSQLPASEVEALTRQGFVSAERRGSQTYFKLRYRVSGKQRVRYLGSDARVADEVAAELRRLQQGRRTMLELNRAARHVRSGLRDCKRKWQPVFVQLGFRFHGRTLRKRRMSA